MKPNKNGRIEKMETRSEFEPGQSWRIFIGEGNTHNSVVHIRAIVDADMIVYRWWSKDRQSWQYEIRSRDFFDGLRAKGYMTPRGNSR